MSKTPGLRASCGTQVLTIWEGTANVLALDVLRVLEQDANARGS